MLWSETYTLSVPKAGNTTGENEDAAAFLPSGCALAVADGATEAPYSRPWAQTLVRRFIISAELPNGARPVDSHEEFRQWVSNCATNALDDELDDGTPSDELPWYVTRGRERGGFATLAGLMISGDGDWKGVFVGDTCLFHLRDRHIVQQVPAIEASAFSNTPSLLSSNGLGNDRACREAVLGSGRLADGDDLVIATDAVACWIAAQDKEARPGALATLMQFDDSEYLTFVEGQRAGAAIKNDDCTLLIARSFRAMQ